MFEFLTDLLVSKRDFAQPVEWPGVRSGSIVVAPHPRASEIGQEVLDAGGNAFDAFVAATTAQNVLAEGASSLAGPLAVLLYRAADRRVVYLDADFNDPLSAEWSYQPEMPQDGRAVLVPGAPAGLQAIAEEWGTWSLSDLLKPSIALAEGGVTVTRLMSRFIKWRARLLRASDYGRRTFFSARGRPLRPGDTMRQPEVASFLANLGSQGAPYVYSGEWGRRFLKTVSETNGVLTQLDLDRYAVRWVEPRTTTYRDYTLLSSSGRSYGGLWTLLALKALENTRLSGGIHYSAAAETLECLVRVARRVWAEGWLFDTSSLEDPEFVAARLNSDYPRHLWEESVGSGATPDAPAGRSHSYHLITRDREGNVANGTTTIQSDPWGGGLFVEGLPLTTAGSIPWNTAPGDRRLSPFSIHMAFRNGALRHAVGGISNSVVEAALQFLVNLIDYEFPAEEAVFLPRFGTYPAGPPLDMTRNWLDPRIPRKIVRTLKASGLKFKRQGVIDTGGGAVFSVSPVGEVRGVVAPMPYLARPFSTE